MLLGNGSRLLSILLGFGCCQLILAINCNCGSEWTPQQCSIEFGCWVPRKVSGAIPSVPDNVVAQYFTDNNLLGLDIYFNAPAENASLVRFFDVTVVAQGYPVGWQECFRVKLNDRVTITADKSFHLHCLNTDHLNPRQKYGIVIQPSPSDSTTSNKEEIHYYMPGCKTIGPTIGACSNYGSNAETWVPAYRPIVEDLSNCHGSCRKITFDTYEWTERDNIATYRITVHCKGDSTGDRTTCPQDRTRLVNCEQTLRQHIPYCNTTFYNLEPNNYIVYQQVQQDCGPGCFINGGVRIYNNFSISDPGAPIIDIKSMPDDITKSVNDSSSIITVPWLPPIVSNYEASMVTLTSTHEPGDNFTVGSTVVTYTATDWLGRHDDKSFTVTVNVPSTAPPTTTQQPTPPPPYFAQSPEHSDKQKLIIGASAGVACAVILLALVLVLKLKGVMKKPTDTCSVGSEDRKTPTESTDTTPYNDKDNLMDNPQVIAGSRANMFAPEGTSSQHPCYDDDEFNRVIDDVSLNGQEFGPTPMKPPPPLWPNVTVNVIAGPQSLEREQTAWVSKCVENEKEKKDFGYDRLDSYDSGICEHFIRSNSQLGEQFPSTGTSDSQIDEQFPSTEVTSVSQVSFTEEC